MKDGHTENYAAFFALPKVPEGIKGKLYMCSQKGDVP